MKNVTVLKRVARCKDCPNRVYDFGVGFVPSTTMLCSQFGIEVEDDDGCTFGSKGGKAGYVTRGYDVSLDGYAAVNGWNDYCDV